MQITMTSIPEVLVVDPKIFRDERGFFFESYNEREFHVATGLKPPFVQDNYSRSRKGVLRGLHYQIRQPQGKLVRVVRGRAFNVAVDLRKSSPTFGKWVGASLDEENCCQMWVPSGFANGFLAMSDTTDVLYKTTDYYSPVDERCIAWDDPSVRVAWPLEGLPVLSARDRQGMSLTNAEVYP